MTNGNMVDFPGDNRIIKGVAYQNELENPETLETVRDAVADICQLDIGAVATLDPDKVRFVRAKADLPLGTVKHERKGGEGLLLITHTNFPKALNAEMELSPVDALELAARFTIAYGLFVVGDVGRQKPRRLTFSDSISKDLWGNGSVDEYPATTLAFRAAGSIALYGQGRPNINAGDLQPPFPPHIAGLINHLSTNQTRQLHPFFKA